jgi:hypothetical protein
LGLAGLLVARGYFSASLLLPDVPQGNVSLVMSDVGLGAGTAIVLGMIWGVVDVAIFAARRAEARARRVRLPRFGRRKAAEGEKRFRATFKWLERAGCSRRVRTKRSRHRG